MVVAGRNSQKSAVWSFDIAILQRAIFREFLMRSIMSAGTRQENYAKSKMCSNVIFAQNEGQNDVICNVMCK